MSASDEHPPTGHSYVTHPATLPDVIRSAQTARENSGKRQWIHHHPHGHPCNSKCGPLAHAKG